ncbi:MAG: putative 2OG-Fe(II) oxygenase [Dongiaceae bacterium]
MTAPMGPEAFASAETGDWPAGQTIAHLGDARIVLATRFGDWPRYHDGLLAAIAAAATDAHYMRRYIAAFGGTKVESPERWEHPAANLVCRRALAFCAAALGSPVPHAFESWANVYRAGDYAMPHSHPAATVSLLYVVDIGTDEAAGKDHTEDDPLSGHFAIVDPRYPACCKAEPGRVTNPVMPKLSPGMMLLFPGWLVHSVNPHRGTRPRITMTWNVRLAAEPPGMQGSAVV